MSVTTLGNPLDALALQYGSDKTPLIKHHYTQFYWPFFEQRRETVRKLLEIGVGDAKEMAWTKVPNYQTGASLRMWRDYFPNALIYGADIKPLVLHEERIAVYRCDQSHGADLLWLLSRTGADMDVVIDDGSHLPDHQVFTCKTLMPHLPQDVTYIIEDVGHPEIKAALSEYDVEEVNFKPRCSRDDRLLIVRQRG